MSSWSGRALGQHYNNNNNNKNTNTNQHHHNGGGGGGGNGGESGILRKAKVAPPHVVEPHHLDDLLVFGYACKIFRDDGRATQIDHGKHLIPWMGDASLKIDRYDVRATMSDIVPYEAPAGGYTDQLATLTLAEQRAEQLCEEERYHSLYNNDVEEEMYKDETLKRLHRERSATYGQVAFDYDGAGAGTSSAIAAAPTASIAAAAADGKSVEDQDEEPFAVNPRFYVPPTIEVPDTMKLHAVIEKTAKFIAAQGPQMEILIKAKQSNNPQFEFLNQSNRLNPYYKHVLNAIKNDYYPLEEPEPGAAGDSASASDGVATPPATVAVQPPVVVPQIKYKPSADCAYTQLISKIKGVPMPHSSDGTASPSDARDSPDSFSREVAQRHIKEFEQFQRNTQSMAAKSNPPSLATPKPHKNGNDPTTTNTAATVEVKKISNALMLAQCYNSDTEDDTDDNDAADDKAVTTTNTAATAAAAPEMPIAVPAEMKMPADIPIPPAELQNIIDKTAAYVLKNGKEFEEILRTKNDQRFSFLTYTDQYYRYYVFKVTGAMCSGPIATAEETTEPPKSVSFSIKAKEETAALTLRPALPLEPSSDEEDAASADTKPAAPATICSPGGSSSGSVVVVSAPVAVGPVSIGLLPTPSHKVLLPTPTTALNVSSQVYLTIADNSNGHHKVVTYTPQPASETIVCEAILRDSLLDAPSTVPTLPAAVESSVADQRADMRRADALKDRLAQAARDKLGAMSREKQLQLERRKKAMAFLNQMKTTTVVGVESPSKDGTINGSGYGDVVVIDGPVNDDQRTADDGPGDDGSVHSVHSSPARSAVIVLNGGVVSSEGEDDDGDKSTDSDSSYRRRRRKRSRSRSRSPSASSSRRHKHKKTKHHDHHHRRRHHSKKKSSLSRRSRSRSRSRSMTAPSSASKSRRDRRSRSRSSTEHRGGSSYRHGHGSSSSSNRHRSSRRRDS